MRKKAITIKPMVKKSGMFKMLGRSMGYSLLGYGQRFCVILLYIVVGHDENNGDYTHNDDIPYIHSDDATHAMLLI
jgi:hypothetical protein